jgi:peptidoglycan/LPS O-acetylase OafA/YrhL
MKTRERLFELDVLRGIAILLVMGVHVPAYPIWSTIGGWGVDLFFVLSGFLISNLLFTEYQDTGDIQLLRFFFRRALKLYPSFYLLLGLTMVYCFFWHVPFRKQDLLGELVLTQNYIGKIWGHTWSLAVEEHFYLLLPLVLTLMMRRRTKNEDPFQALPYLFLGVAVSCLLLRVGNAWRHPVFSYHVHYEPSHLRIDSLFFGVFLSYLHNFRRPFLQKLVSGPWRLPLSIAGILALSPALLLPATDPIIYTVGFTLVYFSFGTMLLLSIYKEKERTRAKPGIAVQSIARMGAYSYTLYLWHVPMAQVFGSIASRLPAVNEYVLHAVYFATSMAVGILASKLVERPILKLRDFVWPASGSNRETRASFRAEPEIPESGFSKA